MSAPYRVIEDKANGRKWEIYKKSNNEYFYKYYEFYSAVGWRCLGREGDHINGYLTREYMEQMFGVSL